MPSNRLVPVRRRVALAVETLEDRLTPAIFNVAAGDVPGFVNAINTANNNGQLDIIKLDGGTYTLKNASGMMSLPTLLSDSGNSLVIQGNGSTIQRDTSNAAFRVRLLEVAGGARVTVTGLSLRDGSVPDEGGAIRNFGSLTLTDVAFLDNVADSTGGAISNDGTLNILRGSFDSNTAGTAANESAGAIHNRGSLTIAASQFTNNQSAETGNAAGAIATQGTLMVSDSTFTGNQAPNPDNAGGAIFHFGGITTIERSLFSGNTSRNGAAIRAQTTGTVEIVDSTFANNTATNNGGAISSQIALTVRNSTFSGNTAAGSGGAMRIFGGTVAVLDSTLTANRGTGGAGGISLGAASLTLHNTIVAGNFQGGGSILSDVNGVVGSGSSNNLIGVSSGFSGITHGTGGNQIGSVGGPLDPRLGPLGDNGGPLPTHAPRPDSPAIDAGTNAEVIDATDQRGQDRVSGGTVDIGAVEFQQPGALAATAGLGQSATVNTNFTTNLQITARDGEGLPLAGVTVTFAGPTSGAGVTFPSGSTAMTDANGRASVAIEANTVAGSFSVIATTGGLNSATFTLTNTPGAAASVVAFTGTPQSATVSTAYANPFQARVTDAFGNPVSGVSVTFAAPGSGASGTFAGAASVATDVAGIATAPAFSANTVAGGFTVTASVAGVGTPAIYQLINTAGVASAITATSGGSQTAAVDDFFAAPLVATVTDAFGNSVTGVTVTFAAPGSGASAVLIEGATAVTDANGQVFKTLAANTVMGTYAVTATAAGLGTAATFSDLTNIPGIAAVITASAGGDQSATVGTAFATPLTTAVTDAFGNPVAGVNVNFTAPSPGASGTFAGGGTAVVATDAAGIATAPAFTANLVAGGFIVIAAVSGAASARFALTNLALPVLPPASSPTGLRALGSAPGHAPIVRVFHEDGSLRFRLRPFRRSFRGGVRVLVGDFDGDGSLEVIAVPRGAAGLPVKVFDGRSGALLAVLYPFGKGYRSRVAVVVADFNGDGSLDLVARTSGVAGRAFSGRGLSLTRLV